VSRGRRALVACSLQALLALGACGDPVSHPYAGRQYLEDRGCLSLPSVVDVVPGGDPGSCPPTCLFTNGDPSRGTTRAVYIGTKCPPFPPDYDTSGKDPACEAAIAAFARDDTCLADGGSSHPPPTDAGATD
jgi:hypothetical protein